MNKRLLILLVLSVIFLVTCKKLPELKIYTLEINQENVQTTQNTAIITANYLFPTEIYELKVLASTNSDMSNAIVTEAAIGDNTLTAIVEDLQARTKYYYCYRYSNGINFVDTEVKNFTTQDTPLPSVTTSWVTEISSTSALCGGVVVSSGQGSVTERGVCWSIGHNPTTSDSHINSGTGTGDFTVNLTGLVENTTYNVRAYATNSVGTAYGGEISFTTTEQQTNYTIGVSASPSSGGTVSGGGTYQQGQSCTVRAVANSGYSFVKWTENSTQVSTNANYSFTVNGNRTLVANFTYNGGSTTPELSEVTVTSWNWYPTFKATATGSSITSTGFVWSESNSTPVINGTGCTSYTGPLDYTLNYQIYSHYIWVRAFAVVSSTVYYGPVTMFDN